MEEDGEDALVPPREKCEEFISTFIEITGSNSAVAQQFLQENQWNLELAVPAFYNAVLEEQGVDPPSITPSTEVSRLFGEGKEITSEPPPRLQLLSWNLDGLDERCLKKRMVAVVTVVQRLEPDVVFFQEVIPEMLAFFQRKLPEYVAYSGESPDGYFNITLVRIFTTRYDSHVVVPFPGSKMGRHFVLTRLHVGSRHFALLNTHLESGTEFSQERVSQLRAAFSAVQSIPNDVTVVVGGDLNLRDHEAARNVPYGFSDAWEASGSKTEFKWTWDTRRNTNKGFGPNGPRARFDRVYVRAEDGKVRTQDFGLVGAKRANQTQMFPSDHWGVFVYLQLKH